MKQPEDAAWLSERHTTPRKLLQSQQTCSRLENLGGRTKSQRGTRETLVSVLPQASHVALGTAPSGPGCVYTLQSH